MTDLLSVHLFRANDKMAELIQSDCRYLLVLERFRIPLGFGNRSIAELCRIHGVDEYLFLLIVNSLRHPTGKLELQPDRIPVEGLLEFLRRTHTYFIQYQLPLLREKLRALIADSDPVNQSLLNDFFNKYEKEVIRHMRFEENQVYPYMKSCYDGTASGKHDTTFFARHHNDIEQKINDLRNIIVKYLPPLDDVNAVNELLFALYQSEDDLNRHTHIEEQILFPTMRYYESKMKANEQK